MWPETLPIRSHSEVLMGGFLLSFCAGFLFTAIPRIVQAPPVSRGIVLGLSIFITGGVLLSLSGHHLLAQFHYLGALLLTAFGLFRAFSQRMFDPPPFFIFVVAGLCGGVLGLILMTTSVLVVDGGPWLELGKNLYFQFMVLSFVLGIGSRIIPHLLGWKEHVFEPKDLWPRSSLKNLLRRVHWHLILSLLLLVLSFFAEVFWNRTGGLMIRAVMIASIAFGPWRLFRIPKNRHAHAYFLWVSSWCLILGSAAQALSDNYRIHWLHMVFIASFSLMTLMVGYHVFVEHEGWELKFKRSAWTWAMGLALLAAFSFRLGIVWDSANYLRWMEMSAYCWILGFVIWIWRVTLRLSGESAGTNCT